MTNFVLNACILLSSLQSIFAQLDTSAQSHDVSTSDQVSASAESELELPVTFNNIPMKTINSFFQTADLYWGPNRLSAIQNIPYEKPKPKTRAASIKEALRPIKLKPESRESAVTNTFEVSRSTFYRVIPMTQPTRIVLIKPCVCQRPASVQNSQMQCRVQGRLTYAETGGKFTTICRLKSTGLRHSITTNICVPVKSSKGCALRSFTRVSKTVTNRIKRYGRQ